MNETTLVLQLARLEARALLDALVPPDNPDPDPDDAEFRAELHQRIRVQLPPSWTSRGW